MKTFIFLLALLSGTVAHAGTNWKGTYYQHLSADPTTLNPITSTDIMAQEVQVFVFDSLLAHDEDTYEWRPGLAEKWETSKDGTVFTFKLRDGIKWHDGQPLTAEDVKYSFDVFFEGRFQAPQAIPYLSQIKEVKVVDPKTVQFTTKEPYFLNFNVIAGQPIIPKHFYGTGDPNDPKFNKTLIGTGPYKLDEWVKGQKITLSRNTEYWGNNLPYFKERWNFKRVFFRPVKEEAVALELLKKGDLDFLRLTPEQYVQKTKGPEWGTKVVAVKAENSSVDNFAYSFIAWNSKNTLFKDRDARMAMSHLINREFMNQKFRYGMSDLAHGPFGNRSPTSSPNVKPVPYDPKKALELLQKNGWKLGPKGLTKTIDGKETPFEFTLNCANSDFEKYLTVIKEDMKKVGITMNIRIVEWNTFIKLIDQRKFDAITMGWGAGELERDPKQIWHSDAIPPPGQNFVSYNNPELDKLIDQVRRTMDKKKRQPIYWKIDEMIANDQPYSFLFNPKFTLYGATKRIKRPKDTLKYDIAQDTWSTDIE